MKTNFIEKFYKSQYRFNPILKWTLDKYALDELVKKTEKGVVEKIDDLIEKIYQKHEKQQIQLNSKWQHKDGGIYEVIEITPHIIGCYEGLCIWYKNKQGEIYTRTKNHFLDSFKKYEE